MCLQILQEYHFPLLPTNTVLLWLQTLHDERFLLVIKTSPPTHGESTAAGVPSVPVIESTTLVLVSTDQDHKSDHTQIIIRSRS
jgi:hypothetical protein